MSPDSRLLGGWSARLSERVCRQITPAHELRALPVDLPRVVAELQNISTPIAAQMLLDSLLALPLRAISLDTEYGHARQGDETDGGRDRQRDAP